MYRGRIVEFLPASGDPTDPDVRIVVLDGALQGQTVDGHLQGPSGAEALPRYQVGDEVIVNASTDPDSTFIAVADLYRIPALALLLVLFAVAVTVVGGWRGVRSLIALALTLAVIVKIVVPLIIAGRDPVWVAIGGGDRGDHRHAAADRGRAHPDRGRGHRDVRLAGAGGACSPSCSTSWPGSRRSTARRKSATCRRRAWATSTSAACSWPAIIFGALGILDDVTVTQAATVAELHDANPSLSRMGLARRSMNVGRSHIAATVNTLVLAYVGASLPLIVLFAAGRQSPLLTASMEIVAVEFVRAIVGSIGIVAAVPLTTAVAVVLTDRRLPFIRPIRAARRAASTAGTDRSG